MKFEEGIETGKGDVHKKRHVKIGFSGPPTSDPPRSKTSVVTSPKEN